MIEIVLFFQDDILCLFQVCQEINPADTNLVAKCCKLLVKVLPKLGCEDEKLFKSTIYWILSSIICLKNHEHHSEQINEILHFYVCTIQAYGNFDINSNEVRNHFMEI